MTPDANSRFLEIAELNGTLIVVRLPVIQRLEPSDFVSL
jgi:hypothetical protein